MSGLLDVLSDPQSRQMFGAGLLDMTAGFGGRKQDAVSSLLNRRMAEEEAERRNKQQEWQMEEAKRKQAAAQQQQRLQAQYMQANNPELAAQYAAFPQKTVEQMFAGPGEGFTLSPQGMRFDAQGNMIAQNANQKTSPTTNVYAGGGPKLPASYMWVDPNNPSSGVKPIPGSPEDIKAKLAVEARQAEQAGRGQAMDAKASKTENLQGLGEQAKRQADKLSTGFIGQKSRDIGGTPAYNLGQTVNTLQANAGFDRLQQMRDESKTGGALGQVSERELQLLTSSVASLDPNQGEEQFKQNVDRYLKTVKESWNRVYDAYEADYGTRHPDDTRAEKTGGGWSIKRK